MAGIGSKEQEKTHHQLCATKAISDASNTHLNAVMKDRSERLLDAIITDNDFPFVTEDKFVIDILNGICKPHHWSRGSGMSMNYEYATHEAYNNQKKQLEDEESLYLNEFCQHKTASRQATSLLTNPSNLHTQLVSLFEV